MRCFLYALLVAACLLLAGATPVDRRPMTNAEAMRRGLPLIAPSSVLRCPPGGCSRDVLARHRARALAPRAQTSSIIAPSACAVGDNLQKYQQGIAGIMAPPVCKSGDYWYQSGIRYNFPIDAINQSCYVQMDKCQLAANKGGNAPPLTVENCNNVQSAACLAKAKETVSKL